MYYVSCRVCYWRYEKIMLSAKKSKSKSYVVNGSLQVPTLALPTVLVPRVTVFKRPVLISFYNSTVKCTKKPVHWLYFLTGETWNLISCHVFSVLPQVSSIIWRHVGNRTVTQFAPRLVFNVLEQARAFQTHLLYPYLIMSL